MYLDGRVAAHGCPSQLELQIETVPGPPPCDHHVRLRDGARTPPQRQPCTPATSQFHSTRSVHRGVRAAAQRTQQFTGRHVLTSPVQPLMLTTFSSIVVALSPTSRRSISPLAHSMWLFSSHVPACRERDNRGLGFRRTSRSCLAPHAAHNITHRVPRRRAHRLAAGRGPLQRLHVCVRQLLRRHPPQHEPQHLAPPHTRAPPLRNPVLAPWARA